MGRASRLGFSVWLLFALLFASAPTLAQDSGFFPSDFARSPLDREKAPARAGSGSSSRGREESRSLHEARGTAAPTGWMQEMGAEPTPTPAPPVEGALTAGDRVLDVLSVGAILNAMDKAHYHEKLSELSDTLVRHDFDAGPIYALGSYTIALESSELIPLVVRGATVSVLDVPPSPYHEVRTSPTWIVRTKEGDFLLEATGPLRKHFTQRGQFIDRQLDTGPAMRAGAKP